MVCLASHYLCLGWQDLVVFVLRLYLTSSLSNNFTGVLMSIFLQYNYLLPPIHDLFCWDIGRTTWYQALTLVTFRMKYWRWFSSTSACSPLLLTRKSLLILADSRCHMHVTLSLPSIKLFQNVTLDGRYFYWTHWNKGWSILLWYSCRQ